MSDKMPGREFIVPSGYPMPPMVGPSDSVVIRPRISIVTPWLNHPELIPAYEAAVVGAEVIVIDSGSQPAAQTTTHDMVGRLHGKHHLYKSGEFFSFAGACNYGLHLAKGDIVMFLNNDITADAGWLDQVERDVRANPNALLGPSTDVRGLAGRAMLYVEGWCIAAQRDVWDKLGGWDAETFTRPYWEDVDLCWRATRLGIRLRRRAWPVRHISNVTSDSVPGAKDATDANRDALELRVAAYDAAEGVARI